MAAAAVPAADSRLWPTKPPFVVQPASGQHKSTVIMLHGLVRRRGTALQCCSSVHVCAASDAAQHALMAFGARWLAERKMENTPPLSNTITCCLLQGDSGIGWAFLPKLLAADLPHTQWVLPNAPVVSLI